MLDMVLTKLFGWGDKLFGYITYYTEKYPQYIVIGGIVLVASKIFKVKINLGGGK
jgi:hypothetical protein